MFTYSTSQVASTLYQRSSPVFVPSQGAEATLTDSKISSGALGIGAGVSSPSQLIIIYSLLHR